MGVGAVDVDDGGAVVVVARSDVVEVDVCADDVDGDVTLDDESPDPHPTRTAATITATIAPARRQLDRGRGKRTSAPDRDDNGTSPPTLMTPHNSCKGGLTRGRGPHQAERPGRRIWVDWADRKRDGRGRAKEACHE
jgi:hypothetical protein